MESYGSPDAEPSISHLECRCEPRARRDARSWPVNGCRGVQPPKAAR